MTIETIAGTSVGFWEILVRISKSYLKRSLVVMNVNVTVNVNANVNE